MLQIYENTLYLGLGVWVWVSGAGDQGLGVWGWGSGSGYLGLGQSSDSCAQMCSVRTAQTQHSTAH